MSTVDHHETAQPAIRKAIRHNRRGRRHEPASAGGRLSRWARCLTAPSGADLANDDGDDRGLRTAPPSRANSLGAARPVCAGQGQRGSLTILRAQARTRRSTSELPALAS